MSDAAFGIAPFSARVDLWLECEHGRVPLAQVGSTFVVASSPHSLPRCQADVVVSVDGREHARRVTLTEGMSENDLRATVLAMDAVPF